MSLRLSEGQYRALRSGKRLRGLRRGKRWEDALAAQLDAAQLAYVREFRFIEPRRFRFDFAFPRERLAVEIDGGVHRIDARWRSDREKGNLAIERGWRVLHFATADVRSGDALALIERTLASIREG